MHRWKVGDEVWARFYDLATDNYVARLYGRVTGVGRDGFTVRLERPLPKGPVIERHRHDEVGYWPTKAEVDEYIAAHPFNVGPGRGGSE